MTSSIWHDAPSRQEHFLQELENHWQLVFPLNVLTTIPFRWKLPILPGLLLVWHSLPKVSLELIVATNHILLLIMTSNYILWIFSRNGGSVRTTPWCSRDFYCPYVFQVHHLSFKDIIYQRHIHFWCLLFSLLRFVDSFDPLCKFFKILSTTQLTGSESLENESFFTT